MPTAIVIHWLTTNPLAAPAELMLVIALIWVAGSAVSPFGHMVLSGTLFLGCAAACAITGPLWVLLALSGSRYQTALAIANRNLIAATIISLLGTILAIITFIDERDHPTT